MSAPKRMWVVMSNQGLIVIKTASGDLVTLTTYEPEGVVDLVAQGQRAAKLGHDIWLACYELAAVPIPIPPPVKRV